MLRKVNERRIAASLPPPEWTRPDAATSQVLEFFSFTHSNVLRASTTVTLANDVPLYHACNVVSITACNDALDASDDNEALLSHRNNFRNNLGRCQDFNLRKFLQLSSRFFFLPNKSQRSSRCWKKGKSSRWQHFAKRETASKLFIAMSSSGKKFGENAVSLGRGGERIMSWSSSLNIYRSGA